MNAAVILSSQQKLPSIPVQRRAASSSNDSRTLMKESVPFPLVSINNHERSVNNSHGVMELEVYLVIKIHELESFILSNTLYQTLFKYHIYS